MARDPSFLMKKVDGDMERDELSTDNPRLFSVHVDEEEGFSGLSGIALGNVGALGNVWAIQSSYIWHITSIWMFFLPPVDCF